VAQFCNAFATHAAKRLAKLSIRNHF